MGIILVIIMYKLGKICITNGSDAVIGTVFGGVLGIAMVFAGFINGFLHLINPAYYALEFFINLVK
jgi:hypothetical protein